MSDSFKIEDNYIEKKKKKPQRINNKIKNIGLRLLVVVLASTIIVLLIMIFRTLKYKINVSKINSDIPYIYTIKKEDNQYEEGTYDEVPAINIVGDKYSNLNKAIMNNYLSVSKKDNYTYAYKYNRYKNILSLLVSYAYYEEGTPVKYFESIIIDLNKDKILNKNEILDRYNIDENKVNIFLGSKFKTFYTDIINKGYYTSDQCDYECFLNNRDISGEYTDGLAYYIDGKSLIGYKYFNFSSSYGEEDYFLDRDYEFVIKE